MIAVPPTLGTVVADLAARLHDAGIPAPRQEARRIVRDLVGPGAPDPVLAPDAPAPAALGTLAREAARRRASGEPIAYVTGWCGFRHLDLRVDRRVLIPRPETEQLVDLVLERVSSGRALDVGTGSGCVALSLAAEGGFDEVVAVDLSPGALAVARDNGARLGLGVRWVAGDLLHPVRGDRFNVVVSNPPYIAEDEHALLDASVRDWEPPLALVGGPDGMTVIRRLLKDAPAVLVPGGWLVLEVDAARAALAAEEAHSAGWRDVAVTQDLFGRDRFLAARRG